MKKFDKIIILFILLQPILDITAGANFYNINVYIRGLFFIFSICYLFTKNKKQFFLLTVLMFIYFISYLFLYKYSMVDIISNIMHLFYLPIVTLFFINYDECIDKKYLVITYLLYIILYFFCYFFNLGEDMYLKAVKKVGFKGLFNSVNEFSAIIIVVLPMVIDYLIEKKYYITSSILAIVVALISMLTGTKVILGGVLIIFLYFLYNPFKEFFTKQSIFKKILTILFIIIFASITTLVITRTTAYKNAVVQGKFFKIKNIFTLDGINKVVFNDRFSFVDNNHVMFNKAPFYQKLFGVKGLGKTVEIDLFDVFYQYGIIGLLIIISVIIWIFLKSKLKSIYLLSFILMLLISETSGHVLIYPAVIIYLGIICYFNKFHEKDTKV